MTAAADFSTNQPALPNVGANFANNAPYNNYALIKTVPANNSRRSIAIENTSGGQLVIVIDDGTSLAGAPPSGASVFALGGGAGAGQQGGSWQSNTEKGRLQIYSAVGAPQVMIREN